MNKDILYYVHDPMCSWCWGFRPVWDALKRELPPSLSIVNVLGGLAPDSDMPMPEQLQESIKSHWKTIAEKLGTQFNFDFWKLCQPRRSTYPSCRAVIAAGLQNAEEQMIDAIQHAYYLRAMNPSDNSTLITLAAELKLDSERFAEDLLGAAVQKEFERQLELRRAIGVYSFPSMVLGSSGNRYKVPLDYHSTQPSREFIESVTKR